MRAREVAMVHPQHCIFEQPTFFLSAFAPENLVSRDGFGSPDPRQPAHLHTQADFGAYLRDSSRVLPRSPYICLEPPYAIYKEG